MSDIIHFRTHKRWGRMNSISKSRIRWVWSEYDGIRDAEPYDDARNIAWKQSLKWTDIYIKSREDESDTQIILIWVSDTSWDFEIEKNDTKNSYYSKLDDLYRKSTKESHIRYIHMGLCDGISWCIQSLLAAKPKNTLIIIVISSLDTSPYTELIPFAQMNDIIIIHLLHSYEATPEKYKNSLVESHIVNTLAYHTLLREQQLLIQNLLAKNGIGYLQTTNRDDHALVLNNYFKYRYAR